MNKRVLFFLMIGCLGCHSAAPMVPANSLYDQFKKIFAYSEAYPEKKFLVASCCLQLAEICDLLRTIDAGEPLSIVEAAALQGLLDQMIDVSRIFDDVEIALLTFRITLVIPIKRQRCVNITQFYDPNFRQTEDCDRCGSPDLGT
ncbi:MAG: hypothetical protein WCW33_00545 [Candidatus Babeliales bacterium]